jgi:serine/threonine protein kinase
MYGLEGLLAGRTLGGRYLIEEVVGRGGMGAVYRARDERLARQVAVKVIGVVLADEEMNQRLRARFHREARVAATLHHPNVVQIYDFGADDALGLDYLVMELLRGEDLATRLSRKGPPAVGTALEILQQAARGLAAGHRAGLVHRDVKPGNLFLEPGDRHGEVQVKVLDFGIADVVSAADDRTVTHLTVVGRSPFSPAFASPEQLRGEERPGPASDVFSLGAVGFQLLTGRRAFQSSDWRQLLVELSASLAAELPNVKGLEPAARAVLLRALAPEPRDRFPDAGAFAQALEPLLSERPRAGEEPARVAPAQPAPRRLDPTRGATELMTNGATALSSAPFRPAAPDPKLREEVEALLRQRQRPALAPLPEPRRPGRFRRAVRAVTSFLVTTVSVALFAGAWYLALTGARVGDLRQIFAGAAASVVLTPLAVHRLSGRRGSYRFALLGSILGSAAVVYLLAPSHRIPSTLAVLLLAQLAISFVAVRLTGRGGGEE